ncbi:hypothetical protein [Paenibacillus sp. YN15]|uniref:hypothetical protein n=1 Tax=Paenibacillus sp. YN15 TaxID=1742774 RepID=UPI0011BE9A00|nr:hypothetical protein [Paenibacillus sp. YN15]
MVVRGDKAALAGAFRRKLEKEHQRYDEHAGLLVEERKQQGYHSRLDRGMGHPVYKSLEYAAALLLGADEGYRSRAFAIIDRVISLQDTDEHSPTYGIWPYYLEEPLDRMKAPDWNWADFNGKVLVYLLLEQRRVLSPDRIADVEQALKHAAASIIRRNIGPDYTNISLMGAYVTIKAGEILGDGKLFHYGKTRLQKALAFVEENGGFAEYNSPSYSILALEELGRMLKHIEDKECLTAASRLNDLEWACIARHFHPSTKQLSAPHSRCYSNISGNSFLSFLHVGTGMQLDLMEEEELEYGLLWDTMVIQCPEKHYELFRTLHEPRLVRETFYKGVDIISREEIRVLIEQGTPPLQAVTYMTPRFSLGSFAEYDLWNQRRPLMAYWGSPEQCTYFRLRCLHDGQDYASAIIRTFQERNHVIAGVTFAKDHGDFHFILDPLPEEGKLTARQLSLRFEAGGYMEGLQIPSQAEAGAALCIHSGDITVELHPLLCRFGEYPVQVRTGGDAGAQWIEFVLYEGEERVLDFNLMEQAAFVFGLSVFDGRYCRSDEEHSYGCTLNPAATEACATLSSTSGCGEIIIPLKPSFFIPPIPGLVKKVKCGGFIYEPI